MKIPFKSRSDGVIPWKGLHAELFHLTRPARPPLKEDIQILRQWIERNKALFSPQIIKNYTDYFPVERRLIFTVGRDRDSKELIGFSGVYNGGRFPEGVWRVFDRTWTSPRFRVHGILPSFHSDSIFPLHFAFLKQFAQKPPAESLAGSPPPIAASASSARAAGASAVCNRDASVVAASPACAGGSATGRVPEIRSAAMRSAEIRSAEIRSGGLPGKEVPPALAGQTSANPALQANILFFSRETGCSGKAAFLQKLQCVTKSEWTAAPQDRFYKVAPGKRRSCFQRVCFTLLNQGEADKAEDGLNDRSGRARGESCVSGPGGSFAVGDPFPLPFLTEKEHSGLT